MIQSLGKIAITTAGTPERITKNLTQPLNRLACHSFLVECLFGNTGKVYIGKSGMNKSTLAGVFAVLPIPTTNSIASFSATTAYASGGYDVSQIFIDVDVSGEGGLVSVVMG